jgi:hypothetical protein
MAAGHILTHFAPNRKVDADLTRKHRKWPLGTPVLVKTPQGYLQGRIFKHWRIDENRHGASVEFPAVVDMGDANGARVCHEVPFRSMKPVRKVVLAEKLFARLERLTDINNHSESLLAAARALGLKKLVAQFERINRAAFAIGYLHPALYSQRRKAYEQLLGDANRRLSKEQYDKLYQCF